MEPQNKDRQAGIEITPEMIGRVVAVLRQNYSNALEYYPSDREYEFVAKELLCAVFQKMPQFL